MASFFPLELQKTSRKDLGLLTGRDAKKAPTTYAEVIKASNSSYLKDTVSFLNECELTIVIGLTSISITSKGFLEGFVVFSPAGTLWRLM